MTWPTATLDELCEINVGRTPARANPEYWGDGSPWLSIADMSQGREITRTKEQITAFGAAGGREVAPGTVLLSFKLSIGKVARSAIPLYTNEAIAALPIKRANLITEEFLMRALERADLSGGSNRAAMGATLNKAMLREVAIPLPSLPEQRRIAAILDHADALRAKRRQVLAHLDALTQSIFHELFGDLALDTELGSVAKRVTDGTHQPPPWSESGVPFLFVSNITSGEISLLTQKFISDETWADLTRRTQIEVGDVLYSTVGSFGIPAVVRTDARFAFQRHIAHIKPDPSRLNSEFLAAQLAGPRVKRQAARAARGIAQPTVNLADIKKFTIAVPPIDAQEEFSGRIMRVRATKSAVQAAILADDELFASLQARAFDGRL